MNKLKVFLCTLVALSFVGCGPTNYQILKKEADSGNPEKQFELAMKYYKRKPDIEKRKFYLKHAADAGHTKAKYWLGNLYIENKDCDNGSKYLIKAANDGFDRAQIDVGVEYFKGGCLKKDIKKAKEWMIKAYKQDNLQAGYNLAHIFRDEKSYHKSKKYYLFVINYDNRKFNISYKALSYFNLADIELKLGNKVEACSWFILGSIFNIYPDNHHYIDYYRKLDKLLSELSKDELKTAFNKAIEYQFKTFTKYAISFKEKPKVYKNTYFLRGDALRRVEIGVHMKLLKEDRGIRFFKGKKKRNDILSYGMNNLLYASKKLRYSSMKGYYKDCIEYMKEADRCFALLKGENEEKVKEVIKIQIKTLEGLSTAQQEIIDEYINKAQF